jgi:hypothetical protein
MSNLDKMPNHYFNILMKSLQNTLTTNVKIHRLDEHNVMEIFYESIVDTIVDDLAKAGYTITKGSSSDG